MVRLQKNNSQLAALVQHVDAQITLKSTCGRRIVANDNWKTIHLYLRCWFIVSYSFIMFMLCPSDFPTCAAFNSSFHGKTHVAFQRETSHFCSYVWFSSIRESRSENFCCITIELLSNSFVQGIIDPNPSQITLWNYDLNHHENPHQIPWKITIKSH